MYLIPIRKDNTRKLLNSISPVRPNLFVVVHNRYQLSRQASWNTSIKPWRIYLMSVNSYPDCLSKAKIVHMILNKKTEEALQILSRFYNRSPPEIVVGTIKGKRRSVYAVYVQKESTIYTINSDIFYNPFVVLHEFYHHIRTREGVHRGSEKSANMYAKSFIDAYMNIQSADSEWIMSNGT